MPRWRSSSVPSATSCARWRASARTATWRWWPVAAPFERLGDRSVSQPLEAGVIGRALRERWPIVVNDVLLDPDYRTIQESAESRSELTVPLWVGGGRPWPS